MESLTIRLLGKLEVHRAERNINGLHSGKVQELFCYLLLNRYRPHTRESLATLLWPESSSSVSRKYLRQSLWQVHSALAGSSSIDTPHLFVIEDKSVRLESPSSCWLDVDFFERAASEVQGLRGEELDPARAQRLAEAVSLYRGDLLEGCYFDWCICERERFQSMYLTMLDKLMGCAEVTAQYEKGLAYGEEILKHDRARERTYQRMMRLQCLAGDRAGALRQFERCSVSLDEELGVRPSRQTLDIYQSIREDRIELPSKHAHLPDQSQVVESESTGADPTVPLGRLKKLCILLSEIQRQVQEDLRALDQALRGNHNAATKVDRSDASEKIK